MQPSVNKGLLQGKFGIITGIANDMSIAYAIAKEAKQQGAVLGLTYQGEVLHKRIMPLAKELDSNVIIPCDVTDSESVENLFAEIKKKWGKLDFLVHSIAFADKNELRGRYLDTSLNNFSNSLHISCYSLLALTKHAEKLMNNGGSILTLTYYGSQKVIPHYNVMGVAKAALETSVKYLAYDLGPSKIRVNAISAGPIKTLASSGIGNFKSMLNVHEETAPLHSNTTTHQVANSSIYLLSDLSNGVTGEIHYVDGGYNIMGMSITNIENK